MQGRVGIVLCMVLLAVSGLGLSACSTTQVGSADYSIHEAQQAYYVEYGTVQSVRPINLNTVTSSTGVGIGVGAAAGGVTGGVIGGLIGGSTGTAIGAVTGAVAGGVAGGALANSAGQESGLEIAVRLDAGQTVAIVQGADVQFTPGQRVQLITGDGKTRVAPLY